MLEICGSREHGRSYLLGQVEEVLREANGRDPLSLREWQRVASHLDHEFETMPAEWEMDPHARGGVVYLVKPSRRSVAQRRLCDFFGTVAHECAEVAMQWEGREAIYYPAEWGSHHEFAVAIQHRFEKRCEARFSE